jgi:hypothetical protein
MPDPDITIDTILDFTNTVCDTRAKAARRDRAMDRAFAAGAVPCEVCGRALKADHKMVGEFPIGPTCHARLMHWLTK